MNRYRITAVPCMRYPDGSFGYRSGKARSFYSTAKSKEEAINNIRFRLMGRYAKRFDEKIYGIDGYYWRLDGSVA